MKFRLRNGTRKLRQSPPSRGAWIEMSILENGMIGTVVAPLAGGVD